MDNYERYCKKCLIEYTVDRAECYHCNAPTISREERKAELMDKLGEFKKNKVGRQERKKKWELWRKTQAVYWKKTATDYSKWDYFTDESDNEDEILEKKAEPVTPEDNPQFKAMKKDMEERSKRVKA